MHHSGSSQLAVGTHFFPPAIHLRFCETSVTWTWTWCPAGSFRKALRYDRDRARTCEQRPGHGREQSARSWLLPSWHGHTGNQAV